MKVSFCMPVFNKEPYISDAIKSVLGQKYKDYELVIVDDKSTDGSREICEFYANKSKKIRLVYNSKRMGVASSRNIAWEHATGDIICPQDADDMSSMERAGLASKFFTKNKGVGVMYGACGVVDQDNKFIERRNPQPFSIHDLKQRNYIQHITLAHKRNLKVRYREGLTFIDDWYFYLDCIVGGINFGTAPELMGLFRAVPDGLTFKGGFSPKSKVKKKESLMKEFSNLEEDLTPKMKNSLQAYRMKMIVQKVPARARVLDVGCNAGYLLEMLGKKAKSLSGVELAINLAKIARSKGYKIYKNIESVNKKFDCIIIGDVLEHYEKEKAAEIVAECYALLARNGKIVITTPHKSGPFREELLNEHVRDADVSDYEEYDNVKEESLFYFKYAIPVWNLVVISK